MKTPERGAASTSSPVCDQGRVQHSLATPSAGYLTDNSWVKDIPALRPTAQNAAEHPGRAGSRCWSSDGERLEQMAKTGVPGRGGRGRLRKMIITALPSNTALAALSAT